MKPILKIIPILLLLVSTVKVGFAQVNKMKYRNRIGDSVLVVNTAVKEPRIKTPPPLRREHTLGLRLNTDGWMLSYNYGIIKKNEGSKNEIDRFYDVLYFQLGVGERYHPKEQREFSQSTNSAYRNYFLSLFSTEMFKYGKINNFYSARLGVGYKYLIAGKPEAQTVSIHWNTNGGILVGIVKPYYFNTSMDREMKLDPDAGNIGDTLSAFRFTNGHGYRKGWGELNFVPGVYLNTGLKFDFSKKKKNVAGIEMGLGMEMYFQKVHQLALYDPKNLFFNAFIGLDLGWRK
jgi:hypothetical protein